MKIKVQSKIGKYARPLNISFNGENKIISTYNDVIEFDFEKSGEYHLSVEQINDDNMGVISQIFLIILMCFRFILSFYNLDSFNFLDYSHIKPYSIKKNYIIKINSDTNVNLKYKDTSFLSRNNEFSIPYIEVDHFSVQDEKSILNCSTENITKRKNYITITLSIIVFVCFLGISAVFYNALLSKNIVPICMCSAILLFFVIVYVVSLRKIKVSYNKIISKLSFNKPQNK